jgi:hypothetical protein
MTWGRSPARDIRYPEVYIRMAHENPWFIITRDVIPRIQVRLRHPESVTPEASVQQIGRIHGVLCGVRDRQA